MLNFDQQACGTTTTGTGTLTLAASPAAVLGTDPYALWNGAGLGTSNSFSYPYSIVEYSSSHIGDPAYIVQTESGIGQLTLGASLAACTLTRNPIQTWVASGNTPSGMLSSPSAITIGTAANVVIFFGPTSFMQKQSLWSYCTTLGDELGITPEITGSNGSGSLTLTSGMTVYNRVHLEFGILIKSVTLRPGAAYTSGTASLAAALYEFGANGLPGKKLIDFGASASIAAALTTLTASNAVFIPAGFYALGVLAQFTGGSGTPTLRYCGGTYSSTASPFGTASASGLNPLSCVAVSGQTALNDPATTPTLTNQSTNNDFYAIFRST